MRQGDEASAWRQLLSLKRLFLSGGPGEDGRLRPPAAGAARRRSRRLDGVEKVLTESSLQCRSLGVLAAQ